MQVSEQTLGVVDAIQARKSVRVFRPDPVPPDALRAVLEAARQSPSWSNTQPSEVAVLTGRTLAAVKDGFAAKFSGGVEPNPDVPWPRFADPYRARSRENGLRLFELLGIGREDDDKKFRYNLSMQRFFEAPVGLIFYLDKELGPWSLVDLGIFMQTIMLAAVGHGLATCPMAMVGRFPDVLREVLGIADSKRIYCGMALGYEDESAALNQFRSHRAPLEEIVTWYG